MNVGSRQDLRQRGKNIVDVDHNRSAISDAVHGQLGHGAYGSEPIYGDGKAGGRIAEVLSRCEVRIQKRITY